MNHTDNLRCFHCGKSLESLSEALSGMTFCPFCGGRLPTASHSEGSSSTEDSPEFRATLEEIKKATDPRKKLDLLDAAEPAYPNSLGIAAERLFLGRLYERGGKNVDFSIIKCFLWMLYLEPRQFTEKRGDELRQELFAHPHLQKCLDLSGDPDAFMRMYLLRLAGEFIGLFLRGDSRYMRRIFGFGTDSRAPKYLADPVASMIRNIGRDAKLSLEQQVLLARTLYRAFSTDMAGETKWLDESLIKEGVTLSDVQ